MSTSTQRFALAFVALPLALCAGASHAATPTTSAPAATAAADEENAAEQTARRDAYVKRAFGRFDTDKDGKIDENEFAVGLGKFLDRQKAAFNREFAEADTNKDGKLSRAEVRKANPTLFESFSEIDTDSNGFLSRKEIRAAIREQQMHVTVDGDAGDQDSSGATPEKQQ